MAQDAFSTDAQRMQKMLKDSVTFSASIFLFRYSMKMRRKKNIIKCKAKLYETYELLSKRILHKLYAPSEEQQRKIGKEQKETEREEDEKKNK